MSTITAQNCRFALTVRSSRGIVVGPFTVQGFASDDAFASQQVDAAQAIMGVDGKMSAGRLPYIVPQTVTLQADSQSIALFDDWLNAQEAIGDLLFADGSITYPGLPKAYAMVKGVLTRITPFPEAKKVLQQVSYEISWEKVIAAPAQVL